MLIGSPFGVLEVTRNTPLSTVEDLTVGGRGLSFSEGALGLTLKLRGGGGQKALPLNFNAKNIPNADFFLVFQIYVYFLSKCK